MRRRVALIRLAPPLAPRLFSLPVHQALPFTEAVTVVPAPDISTVVEPVAEEKMGVAEVADNDPGLAARHPDPGCDRAVDCP